MDPPNVRPLDETGQEIQNGKRGNEELSTAAASEVTGSREQEEPPTKKRSQKSSLATTDKSPGCIQSLQQLDPILQFLVRATGKNLIALKTIKATIPVVDDIMLKHIPELVDRGVLQMVGGEGCCDTDLAWNSEHVCIGFPSPPSLDESQTKSVCVNGAMHGCTKAAAKRRLAALRRSLKSQPEPLSVDNKEADDMDEKIEGITALPKDWTPLQLNGEDSDEQEDEEILENEQNARDALSNMFKFSKKGKKSGSSSEKPAINHRQPLSELLPKQASYAGSNSERGSKFANLIDSDSIPRVLFDAFGLERPGPCPIITQRRKLFSHQAAAIDSAVAGIHTLVCTGTGSGKSLCFLLPVLAAAMAQETSLLLFPTKALAQDQMIKLTAVISKFPELQDKIKPGVIDGDTCHADRTRNAKDCNVILTNPDTIHAAILPGWKTTYKKLLGRIKYVVIDEAHMYEGVFGAHVAMVLARLIRLTAVCSHQAQGSLKLPIFLACSATMPHPEHHFRLLCPISKEAKVTVLAPDDDGSPRAAKHFFVWNPPILDMNGISTGRVVMPKAKPSHNNKEHHSKVSSIKGKPLAKSRTVFRESDDVQLAEVENNISSQGVEEYDSQGKSLVLCRRHAADETALLLARAVSQGVRCIAFCKTRCLVEWVYEKAMATLKSDTSTEHLVTQIESYRGGYTTEVRRSIESRLFKNDLLGVIGTSALELGVDVGGIDLTLHCGYPSTHASLMQQAGRAGRGTVRLDVPSIAIMISFNAPADQHIWRHPKSFLSRGKSALISMPVEVGLVQGHLLCASEEYPLSAQYPVNFVFTSPEEILEPFLRDYDLFGSETIFRESVEGLLSAGLMKEKSTPVATLKANINVFKCHPFVDKPWTRVNLRSIEPINYAIVDLSHPLQGGKMDGIFDERTVLDTIPYSRVFYHAFPGAIITHRGRRYKVQSMTRPPAFADSCVGYKGGSKLAAYAKPTSARYSTRPLSTMSITVVKQLERIDDMCATSAASSSGQENLSADRRPDQELMGGSLAGSGLVTVRRSVHGYKKLSPITRQELSRTEISLPPMEFDTFAFWLDTEATLLRSMIKEYDEGVHALSHAILAVAPLFVPVGPTDLNCDHNIYDCTKIVIFDVRAGGSGTSAQLFKFVFVPDGLLHAAIDLITGCSQCRGDFGYEGGCPACLHFGQCLKFNQRLNRHAAIEIGKRLLERVKKNELYKRNEEKLQKENAKFLVTPDEESSTFGSPRRNARAQALRNAKEVKPTKSRGVIFGRPSWPADNEHGPGGRQVDADK